MGYIAVSAIDTDRAAPSKKSNIDWEAIARGKAARAARQLRRGGGGEATPHCAPDNPQIASWFADAHLSIEQGLDDVAPREFVRDIMEEIAQQWGVSVEAIKGPRRTRSLYLPRHHAIYEAVRRCPHLSIVGVGRIFNRDHSTLLHALRGWPARAAERGIECLPLNREPKT